MEELYCYPCSNALQSDSQLLYEALSVASEFCSGEARGVL